MEKFKLLLASEFGKNDGQYCYADSFFRILGQNDCLLVKKLDNHPYFFIWLRGKRPNWRIFYYLIFYTEYLWVNFLLFTKMFFWRPDFIFMIKSDNLDYRLLRVIKRWFSCKIFYFYPDSPFAFHLGNSSLNVLKNLGQVDLFLFWRQDFWPALRSAGVQNFEYLPFYPDLELFCDSNPKEEEIYDLCFVGAMDKKRKDLILGLLKSLPDLKLCLVGPMWDEDQALLFYVIQKNVGLEGMKKIFRQSRICLNILKDQNEQSHNMRTFEVPAAGSFLLTEFSLEQSSFFEPEKEVAFFADAQDLLVQVKKYLNNESDRLQIAQAGYQKVQRYGLKKILLDKLFVAIKRF